MLRYYYTKLKLFCVTCRALRNERKGRKLRTKLDKLQTIIATGFTSEKEFETFNKRLIENRKRELDPTQEKQLEELRTRHFSQWKPKKKFKDSKDKQEIQKGQQRSEFVRVLKNRPLKQNPDDLITPPPQGDRGMLYPKRKDNDNG